MKNRALFIVVGLMLVASGAMGLVLYEHEHKKQQEEYTAKAAEEQRRIDEDRAMNEAYKAQLEAEKQRAMDAERKLTAAEEARRREEEKIRQRHEEERQARRKKEAEERQKIAEEERIRRKQEEERQASGKKEAEERQRLAKEEKRRQQETERQRQQQAKAPRSAKPLATTGQVRRPGLTAEQERNLRTAEDRERAREKQARTTVIRVDLDSAGAKEIKVARVHAGDRVTIRVQRTDGANQSLYVGLAPLSLFPYPSEHIALRDSRSGASTLVSTPIKDIDQLTIIPEPRLGTWITKAIESKEGVVLNVGIGNSPTHHGGRASYARRGSYRIEISIYSDNRWNIKPRSLL